MSWDGDLSDPGPLHISWLTDEHILTVLRYHRVELTVDDMVRLLHEGASGTPRIGWAEARNRATVSSRLRDLWLNEQVIRSGKGVKGDPYRYVFRLS